MKLITSDGVEFNAVTITLNEEPSRFSFRIKDMTIPEASDMFCKGNALPIQNYEDFTEVQSINRSGENDVMVMLRPSPENGGSHEQ